jgi:hypothetical protein
VRNPFGGCTIRGNDPFCEAAKAAQNRLYDIDASSKKLDCERLKSQEKLQCEIEKSGEKALCETGKEALKRLARTGKFANLTGGATGTAELEVCLNDFYISEQLDKVQINLGVGGRAHVDTSLKFVPLDIVGHLTCQIPWTDSRSFDASVGESSIPIAANLKLVETEVPARLRFDIGEIPIKFRIKPGPTEWLLTNTNLRLSCPGLNLLTPLVISATPFIPELRGEFEHKEKARTVDLPVNLPEQKLGSVALRPRLKDLKEAIVVTGTLQ